MALAGKRDAVIAIVHRAVQQIVNTAGEQVVVHETITLGDTHPRLEVDRRGIVSSTVAVAVVAAPGLEFDRGQRLLGAVDWVHECVHSALNPAHTVQYVLARPLMNFKGVSGQQARMQVMELLETVGLSPPEQFLNKNPHQLSGGQRQRVVVARALAPDPRLIIADEPISMLDVSIRAEILLLLYKLVRNRRIAMLHITHDLLSARLLSDEVLVLNRGKVVEQGPTHQVIRNPRDEYTRLLLGAIPKVGEVGERGGYVPAEGEAVHVGASVVRETIPRRDGTPTLEA